jgi:hypothetical protein
LLRQLSFSVIRAKEFVTPTFAAVVACGQAAYKVAFMLLPVAVGDANISLPPLLMPAVCSGLVDDDMHDERPDKYPLPLLGAKGTDVGVGPPKAQGAALLPAAVTVVSPSAMMFCCCTSCKDMVSCFCFKISQDFLTTQKALS